MGISPGPGNLERVLTVKVGPVPVADSSDCFGVAARGAEGVGSAADRECAEGRAAAVDAFERDDVERELFFV